MAGLGFGHGKYPFARGSTILENILEWRGKDDWTAQLSMMEHYDKFYGIYDHEAHERDDPLSIIGMHPAEDAVSGSRLELTALDVLACRLPELTNTPLMDVLKYPRWFLERLLDDARKVRRVEEEEAEKMRVQLENTLNGNGRGKKGKRGQGNPSTLTRKTDE